MRPWMSGRRTIETPACVAAIPATAAAVTNAVQNTVDIRAGKITAAIGHRTVATGCALARAVQAIAKAIANAELGVEREKQRQARSLARVDVFFQTQAYQPAATS